MNLFNLANSQQNAYIKRYNRTVREGMLTPNLFDSIEQVQDYATEWLWMYDNQRPHSAIGGIPPAQQMTNNYLSTLNM